MNYQLPYFGQINTAELEDYYQSEVELDGQDVSIYLSFEGDTVDERTTEKIIFFLNNLIVYAAQNSTLIKSDFENAGDAAEYIQYFSKQISKKLLGEVIDPNDGRPIELQLLEKVELMEICLFPDSEDPFAQFDYYIKLTELHSQLLVVRLNELGELVHIAWES
ncbi:hypothetical protein A4H97_09805 [Niastella yeongjuensis]|uniref:DUF2004 domain-containing protein n=1 Tax=Niastella yeongjuensis TaxID=354355 RepID=A0A1V9EEV0_9BACT|nr:DUF2004 domain-containing protein [Niastella yeongjuensis]OQP44650.1 hypothetical protein A4H97_09805 [Niastella yeongjuensis]SEO79894.1 Protein of unknown function [Niastella yeongjuensis]